MDREEQVVTVVGAYKNWGQWLKTIDVAAIAGIGFISQHLGSDNWFIPIIAYLCLLLFGASVVFSTVLVGNLCAIQTKFLAQKDLSIEDIAPHRIHERLSFTVAETSKYAATLFTIGALLFAVLTGTLVTG